MRQKTNFQATESPFVGFTYFSVPLLGIEDWWVATDPDGSVVMYKNQPMWNPDDEQWIPQINHVDTSSSTYLKIAELDFDQEHPRDTLQQIKGYRRDPDRRYMGTDHKEVTCRTALAILGITGMPDRFALDGTTDKEYLDRLAQKEAANSWDYFFPDVLPVLAASCFFRAWSWTSNSKCKYSSFTIRTDMRDLGCIIRNRDGERILPERFALQFSADSKERERLKSIDRQVAANRKARKNETL